MAALPASTPVVATETICASIIQQTTQEQRQQVGALIPTVEGEIKALKALLQALPTRADMETLILRVEETHPGRGTIIGRKGLYWRNSISPVGEESGSAGADKGSASCTGSCTTAAPGTA